MDQPRFIPYWRDPGVLGRKNRRHGPCSLRAVGAWALGFDVVADATSRSCLLWIVGREGEVICGMGAVGGCFADEEKKFGVYLEAYTYMNLQCSGGMIDCKLRRRLGTR